MTGDAGRRTSVADGQTVARPAELQPSAIRPRKGRVSRLLLGAVLSACLVGAGVLTWRTNGGAGAERVSNAQTPERTLTVQPTPLVSRLNAVGTIEPGSIQVVPAPFEGIVREKHFELGMRVERGTPLVIMDAQELAGRIREAQSVQLRAARLVEDMKTWESSADVVRARRSFDAAKITLVDLERQTRETKALLDRGIVSRNEYDGLVQQLRSQRQQTDAAKQDLDAVVARGVGENRTIADLDLANANARLDDLLGQQRLATVTAPLGGIVLRPPASATQGPGGAVIVDVGARLSRGQPLLAIADTETLIVALKIDEVDVNSVHPGQPVEITGDALGRQAVAGEVVSVAIQAGEGDPGARAATFEVRVRLSNLTDTARRRIRVGMSAKVAIKTYENPDALIVPQEAVRGTATAPTVLVREYLTGSSKEIAVTLGAPTTSGIEITKGLNAGDTIVLRQLAPN